MKSFSAKCIVALVCIVFGGVVWFLIDNKYVEDKCNNDWELINEEIRCSKKYVIEKNEYLSTRLDINEYLEKEKSEGGLTRFSVYFRDLDNGPTFGINEKDSFVPASLLKLPLMIAYFRSADEGKNFLQDRVGFDWESPPYEEAQFYKPKLTALSNKEYLVEDLIDYMIKYSDNTSYLILLQHLDNSRPGDGYLLDTFKDIGIIDPESVFEETVTTKSYASLFRALYNASYLSKEFSEKALEILSSVDFKDGLNAGVPSDIVIAHKFGERGNLPNNQKELHDCGIVYFPGNPYLLCVMVEGYEFEKMSQVIKQVSRMVYTEVDSRRL